MAAWAPDAGCPFSTPAPRGPLQDRKRAAVIDVQSAAPKRSAGLADPPAAIRSALIAGLELQIHSFSVMFESSVQNLRASNQRSRAAMELSFAFGYRAHEEDGQVVVRAMEEKAVNLQAQKEKFKAQERLIRRAEAELRTLRLAAAAHNGLDATLTAAVFVIAHLKAAHAAQLQQLSELESEMDFGRKWLVAHKSSQQQSSINQRKVLENFDQTCANSVMKTTKTYTAQLNQMKDLLKRYRNPTL